MPHICAFLYVQNPFWINEYSNNQGLDNQNSNIHNPVNYKGKMIYKC